MHMMCDVENENNVIKMKTKPIRMGKLFGKKCSGPSLCPLVEIVEKMIGKNDHQHIEPPEHVNGQQSLGGVCNGSIFHGRLYLVITKKP